MPSGLLFSWGHLCRGRYRYRALNEMARKILKRKQMRLVGPVLVAQLTLAVALSLPLVSRAQNPPQQSPEQKNMELVGHSDLNGNGDGGEGMAIQQWPDGRRILYIAHEGEKTGLSILKSAILINR